MCRRQFRAGQSGRGRGGEKGGPDEPRDHALGRSRGGYGSKLHLVTDRNGLPLAVHVTAGQVHESTQFEAVLNAIRIPQRIGPARSRPRRVAGDKGYSFPRIRRWLRQHAIEAIIPQREDQRQQHRGRPLKFDRQAYRKRTVIERCIGWLKESRLVGTRFEKLALNYVATVQVAMIRRYLKILVPKAEQPSRRGSALEAAIETVLEMVAVG